MEKFTTWEDKSCGVNPFLEFKAKKDGKNISTGSALVKNLIFFPVALIRIALLGIVLPLTIILDGFVSLIPVWFIQRLLKRLTVAPLCRLMLFLLGYLYINEKVPDPRKLRLARLKKGTVIPGFGSSVYRGDLLVCNSTSFVEVLYLAYRFSCDFAMTVLPDGKEVIRCNLWAALKRSGASYENKENRKTLTSNAVTISQASKSAASSGGPLAVFPEGVRSNGVAVLKFSPSIYEEREKDSRKHIIAFKYSYSHFSPCHTVGSLSSYIFTSCLQVYNSMNVSMVPHELRIASFKAGLNDESDSSESIKDKVNEADHIRKLLAMSVGERGAKLVNLGASEYFAFLDYYMDSKAKRSDKKSL